MYTHLLFISFVGSGRVGSSVGRLVGWMLGQFVRFGVFQFGPKQYKTIRNRMKRRSFFFVAKQQSTRLDKLFPYVDCVRIISVESTLSSSFQPCTHTHTHIISLAIGSCDFWPELIYLKMKIPNRNR